MTQRETPPQESYALVAGEAQAVDAPILEYAPPMPSDRSIGIGLIGAGGISAAHLEAYRKYGLNVLAICDRHLERAIARRDAFFPEARATNNVEDLIGRSDILVLDLTLHPGERLSLMRRALEAGHHVLSQKPFVLDLDAGRALVELAEASGLQLAVNQNGRWAPHMSYMREAVLAGLIGQPTSVQIAVHWDHTWIAGTAFANMPFVILEDFAIHWFDFLVSVIGEKAEMVFATASRARGQTIAAPLIAQALVAYSGGQACLFFNGSALHGASDATTIIGSRGALHSGGPDLGRQSVSLFTDSGAAHPQLRGTWFNDGFAGTMGALLCAVETGKAPLNSARGNLASLRLCRAAVESARTGSPVRLG